MHRPAAAVSVALALGVGACGGSGTSPSLIRGAATATTRSPARVRLLIDLPIAGAGGAVTTTRLTGEGRFDFKAETATVRLDVSGVLNAARQTQTTVTFPTGAEFIDMLFAGPTLYIRSPLLSSFAPPGSKPWLKADLTAPESGAGTSDLTQLGANDPSQAAELLRGAVKATKAGHERVGTTATKHLRAVITAKAARAHRNEVRDRARFDAFLHDLGTKRLTMDVWLDDQGRARRLRYRAHRRGGSSTITIEFVQFDVTVDATPPPPDQISPLRPAATPPATSPTTFPKTATTTR